MADPPAGHALRTTLPLDPLGSLMVLRDETIFEQERSYGPFICDGWRGVEGVVGRSNWEGGSMSEEKKTSKAGDFIPPAQYGVTLRERWSKLSRLFR